MIEKKNIDRLFQEKFKDFDAIPDEKVWQNIEMRLKKKKKRRVIPIWWTAAGVAALLILGLLLWNSNSGKTGAIDTGVVETENTGSGSEQNQVYPNIPVPEEDSTNNSILPPGIKNSDGIATGNEQDANQPDLKIPSREKLLEDRFRNADKQRNSIANSENPARNDKNAVSGQQTVDRSAGQKNTSPNLPGEIAGTSGPGKNQRQSSTESSAIEQNNIQNEPNNPIVDPSIQQIADQKQPESAPHNTTFEKSTDPNINSSKNGEIQIAEIDQKKQDSAKPAGPDSMEELLKEKETNVAVNERKVNRWHISSNVAPIYFSSVSNGSPIDPRFKDNPKAYKPSMSYGVGVQYNINKKLAVRSGINAITLEYNTNDVLISQTPEARKLENVKPNARGSLIQVDNTPIAATTTLGRMVSQFSGNLSQTTGYVEVPVEMTYKILDRKLGIDLVGGVSTLFLNKNEVSVETSGAEVNIGEAENLNDIHFSTNLGVGFRYDILKNFQATVEPVFKYQINTFTNDVGGFKPYFFGLYTGLNYRF